MSGGGGRAEVHVLEYTPSPLFLSVPGQLIQVTQALQCSSTPLLHTFKRTYLLCDLLVALLQLLRCPTEQAGILQWELGHKVEGGV